MDAKYGLAALVFGFVVQVIGYALTLAVETRPNPNAGRAFVALGLALVTSALTVILLAADALEMAAPPPVPARAH